MARRRTTKGEMMLVMGVVGIPEMRVIAIRILPCRRRLVNSSPEA